MKRSEATPELLKALEDPENIYTFEEDRLEAELCFFYLRAKKWVLHKGVTKEREKETERFVQFGLLYISEKGWDTKYRLTTEQKREIFQVFNDKNEMSQFH